MIRTLTHSPALMVLYAFVGWFAMDTGKMWLDHVMDSEPPSRLIYQHPRFVSCDTRSRAAAAFSEIPVVTPGQEVCRWVEWCLDRPADGFVHRTWITDVEQGQTKQPNIGQVGCWSKVSKERIPAFAVVAEMPITLRVAIEYPRRADDPRPHWVYNTPDVEALLVPGKP